MVLKLVLGAALLLVAADAHCHEYPCDEAKTRMALCLERGYQPVIMENCKLGSGEVTMSSIQTGICKKLEENTVKDCAFECEKAPEWPGEGWSAFDIRPENLIEIEEAGSTQKIYEFRSDPVELPSFPARAHFQVKLIKPADQTLLMFPAVELLDESDEVIGKASTRLTYRYAGGTITMAGTVGYYMEDGDNIKKCENKDMVPLFPTDQGPTMTVNIFSPDYKAEFFDDSGEVVQTETVDLGNGGTCDAGDVYRWRTVASSHTKKVRFLFTGGRYMDNLGDYIAFRYKFSGGN